MAEKGIEMDQYTDPKQSHIEDFSDDVVTPEEETSTETQSDAQTDNAGTGGQSDGTQGGDTGAGGQDGEAGASGQNDSEQNGNTGDTQQDANADADGQNGNADASEQSENEQNSQQQNNEQQNNTPAEQENEQEGNAPAEQGEGFDQEAKHTVNLKQKKQHPYLQKSANASKRLAFAAAEIGILSILLGPALGIVAFLVIRHNAALNNMAAFVGYDPMLIPKTTELDKKHHEARQKWRKAVRGKIKQTTTKGVKKGLFHARVGGKQFFHDRWQNHRRRQAARNANRGNSYTAGGAGPSPTM